MSGTTSIKAINAIAIARGTSEPSNRNVLWLDENITGSFVSLNAKVGSDISPGSTFCVVHPDEFLIA